MSAMQMLAEQGIYADRDGVHLLPPEQMQQASALQDECKDFLGKTNQLNELVAGFVSTMEAVADIIETEKLKAIGAGNRVDSETQVRRRKQLELQARSR